MGMTVIAGKYKTVNVGTIGHVDHGKTTLTTALWSFFGAKKRDINEVDKHPEEARRGITISASVVNYKVEKTDEQKANSIDEYVGSDVSHVDCPGHADFVKNMIAGVSKTKIGILLVSAVDGPAAQTLEHAKIAANTKHMTHLIIVLNKIDMIPESDLELVDLVQDEILEKVVAYGFKKENITFVRISATTALKEVQNGEAPTQYGIKALLEIGKAINDVPAEDFETKNKLPFYMLIEDTYSITGRGTVVAGRVETGRLKVGESIQLLGKKKNMLVTVTSLECFNQPKQEVSTGDNAALLIKIERDDVGRGDILCTKGSVQPVHFAKIQLYLFGKEEGGRETPIVNGYMPHTFIGSRDTSCLVMKFIDKEMLEPGETGMCYVAFHKPMHLIPSLTTIIFREGKTIGIASVVDKYDTLPNELADLRGKKNNMLEEILKSAANKVVL